MADDPVEPGVDHLLVFLHLDRPRKIGVLPEHLGEQGIREEKEDRRGVRDPLRQQEPPEPEGEPRRDERREKHEAAQKDDPLLRRLLFPHVQPLAQKLRAFYHHDKTRREHRDEQDPDQKPRPRPVKRSRRDKQQNAHKNQAAHIFRDRLSQQLSVHTESTPPPNSGFPVGRVYYTISFGKRSAKEKRFRRLRQL